MHWSPDIVKNNVDKRVIAIECTTRFTFLPGSPEKVENHLTLYKSSLKSKVDKPKGRLP
jgi:hypothetical protein